MAKRPDPEPMNPFEAAKRHDLMVPQTANFAVEVYPAALRALGRWYWLVAVVAAALVVALVVWAFTG